MADILIINSCGALLNFNETNWDTFTDFIEFGMHVTQDSVLTQIQFPADVYGPNSREAIKFKIWRDNGLNYDFIGQTEPFLPLSHTLNSSNCYILPVNSTFAVQSGDLMGYNIPPYASPNVNKLVSTMSFGIVGKFGDFSTNQTKSSWFDAANRSRPIVFLGTSPIVPPNQASSLVRAKNPDTGDVVSFLTDYDYSTGGFQTIKSYRSLTGNLHSQQINNFRRFEIPLVMINSQNINFLRSWKAGRIRLNFTENHSDTNVDSGFLVVITELNINKFKKPYSQNLWTGNIVVETI